MAVEEILSGRAKKKAGKSWTLCAAMFMMQVTSMRAVTNGWMGALLRKNASQKILAYRRRSSLLWSAIRNWWGTYTLKSWETMNAEWMVVRLWFTCRNQWLFTSSSGNGFEDPGWAYQDLGESDWGPLLDKWHSGSEVGLPCLDLQYTVCPLLLLFLILCSSC